MHTITHRGGAGTTHQCQRDHGSRSRRALVCGRCARGLLRHARMGACARNWGMYRGPLQHHHTHTPVIYMLPRAPTSVLVRPRVSGLCSRVLITAVMVTCRPSRIHDTPSAVTTNLQTWDETPTWSEYVDWQMYGTGYPVFTPAREVLCAMGPALHCATGRPAHVHIYIYTTHK